MSRSLLFLTVILSEPMFKGQANNTSKIIIPSSLAEVVHLSDLVLWPAVYVLTRCFSVIKHTSPSYQPVAELIIAAFVI